MAAWQDCRTYRIPNLLILLGVILGVVFNTVPSAGIGILDSVMGCVTGLLVSLPLYMTRSVGAGDVKLVAMVGTFVGPFDILSIFLLSMLWGGGMAIMVALHKGMLRQLFVNIVNAGLLMFSKTRYLNSDEVRKSMSKRSVGKLPYSIAILGGAITFFAIFKNLTLIY